MKINLIFNVLILFLGSFSSLAFAKDWKFESPEAIPEEILLELRNRFPKLRTQIEVTRFLEILAEKHTFSKLEVMTEGQILIVKAEVAKIVKKIEIKTLTRELTKTLQTKASQYLERIDNDDTKSRLQSDLSLILQDIGFYSPDIKINSEVSDDNVTYQINVTENYPCLVQDVGYGFKLPRGVRLNIETGDVCDRNEIGQAAQKLEDQLLELGYNQQKILPPEIRFNNESNSAFIFVPGSIGKKITYSINNIKSETQVGSSDFFSYFIDSNLNRIDSKITAPDSMRTEIIRNYRNSGYDDVEVRGPEIIYPDENTILYKFNVLSGIQYRITEVQIEGLTVMSQEEALETMGLYTSIGNTPILTQDLIRQGIDNLTSRYHQLGYWDAKVSYPRITKNPATGETKLVFLMNEGKKRTLEQLVIQNASVFDSQTIIEWFPVEPKDPLLWSDLVEFEKKLRESYKEKGYLYTKIYIDLIQNRRFRDILTRVIVKIDEGPQVKIGKIEIKGLMKTESKVVRRELRFEEGDPYDPVAIEESRQALIDLGLFSSVSVRPQDSTDLTQENMILDYVVLVTESKAGTVVFGPGWSLFEGGRFSVETSYANLNGEGRQIFLKAAISEEKDQDPIGNKTLLGRNLGLSLLEPYLFEIPVNGTISFNQRAEADSNQWEITRSLEGILSYKYRFSGPKQRSELFSLNKTTHIEADTIYRNLLLVTEDDVQIREIGLRHIIEARNNISWPTKGYVLLLELAKSDFYLGGDTKYLRWSIKNSLYQELYKDFVLATGFGYDTYQSIERRGNNVDVLPSSELVKSGGANTNRGFKENELGPAILYLDDDGEEKTIFSGGSQRFSLKTEVRYQVIEDTMAISVFADFSNSFFSEREENIIRQELSDKAKFFDNIPYSFQELFEDPSLIVKKNYLSFGSSISYLTPLGSFNLSYGFPWRRCPGGKSCSVPRGNQNYQKITGGQLHISVGATF